jgi:hypothetical protein
MRKARGLYSIITQYVNHYRTKIWMRTAGIAFTCSLSRLYPLFCEFTWELVGEKF